MRSWEQRESARTGKPVPQVLALKTAEQALLEHIGAQS